jgi:hypothetical protein
VRLTQSFYELRTASNSVSITRLPLDPELLSELFEKLPSEVFEQLTHNRGKQTGARAERTKEWAFARTLASDAGEEVWTGLPRIERLSNALPARPKNVYAAAAAAIRCFLDHPILELSSNAAENAIGPVALGQKDRWPKKVENTLFEKAVREAALRVKARAKND